MTHLEGRESQHTAYSAIYQPTNNWSSVPIHGLRDRTYSTSNVHFWSIQQITVNTGSMLQTCYQTWFFIGIYITFKSLPVKWNSCINNSTVSPKPWNKHNWQPAYHQFQSSTTRNQQLAYWKSFQHSKRLCIIFFSFILFLVGSESGSGSCS